MRMCYWDWKSKKEGWKVTDAELEEIFSDDEDNMYGDAVTVLVFDGADDKQLKKLTDWASMQIEEALVSINELPADLAENPYAYTVGVQGVKDYLWGDDPADDRQKIKKPPVEGF